MLTARGYSTCLGLIRQRFGKSDETGARTLPTIPNGGGLPIFVPLAGLDDNEHAAISLIYLPYNMYIQGYRAEGKVILFGDTQVVINHTAKLPFGSTYQNMGWNKNIDNTTVTLADVDAALWAISGGSAGSKAQMLAIVVAFAEGARFWDVEKAVTEGTEITNDMVNWDKQKVAGHTRLVQG